MRAYLFSWNTLVPQEFVASVLNGSTAVETWVSPIPTSAIVISKLKVIYPRTALRFGKNHILDTTVVQTRRWSDG